MESVIDRACAAALYAEGDAALDTGASLLAAAPDADDAAHRRGEDFVRRAWERGWHPADLVRFVRRELDERRAALAGTLIAAETGRYAELPPRWRQQLAGLPESVPRNRPDRFSYAADLLELYRVLLRLPAIEPVGPPPGAAADHLHRPPAADEPRMLTRIRALLAKAEATGFPEEAEALTTKAQELMARHTIDEALLAARTQSRDDPGGLPDRGGSPVRERQGGPAGRRGLREPLPGRVERGPRLLHGRRLRRGPGGGRAAVHLAARPGATAMTRAEAGQRAGGRKRTKTFRQAFWMGYARAPRPSAGRRRRADHGGSGHRYRDRHGRSGRRAA
ncbi:Protein of unknown function, partial [Streptomyces sp. Ncost-T6T-2b]